MGLAGTMIGMQSPFSAQPAPPAPAPAGPPPAAALGLKQTMMGFAGPSPAQLAASAPAPQVARQPGGVATQPFAGMQTYPSHGAPPNVDPPPAAPASQPVAPQMPARPMHQQTMLGVARPGIAPLHAGQPRAEPQSAPAPRVAPPAAERPQPSFEPEEPRPERRHGLPKGAIILIIVSALLAVSAGVVAFLWESPRPIRAEVVLDDRGAEALALTCEDCPNATTVSSGSSRAVFTAKKAQLPLTKPLEIGKNDILVALHRPGMGRDEEVTLAVAVDYRARGVLSSLSEDPPKVKVAIQALPGAAAVVDGRPVVLDATGKGEHSVDVSKELEGPADTILPFERKLPYAITPSGGATRQGEVTLRFGIAPLRIDAPGDGIIVESETFMLSGRTLKDGRITVSGRPITVDAEGRFAQLMNVSSIGQTTIVVRAEAKDHAPRLVRVRVKRVASLREEGAAYRQTAIDDYAAIAAADSKKGATVALNGEVVETRLDGEMTVLLLEVKKGCTATPCLAKVVYGGRFDARKGAVVGAFGHVLGSVDGPRTGIQIPEIAAEFLLPQKAR